MGETLAALAGGWIAGVFVFLLGLCVGSFLNVCIHRLPAGKSLVWPGSHCPRCLAPIAWYDNLPVVSYVVLGGRCRRCGSRFTARYMAVELATGLLFFGYWLLLVRLGVRPGAGHMGVWTLFMVLVAALLVSSVIDFERKEIYPAVTNLVVVVAVLASALWPRIQAVATYAASVPPYTGWRPGDAAVAALVGAGVGAGMVLVTRVLATAAFRKEAMGLGDAHLMAAVGAVLGWQGAVLVFFLAPFLALPYGLWQMRGGARGEDEEDDEAATEEDEPPGPRVPWASAALTLAGLLLMAFAGLQGRTAWTWGPRLMTLAGLAAVAYGFYRAERDEDVREEADEPMPRAPESHEVPYGPFLGATACIMMVAQDAVLNLLLHRLAG